MKVVEGVAKFSINYNLCAINRYIFNKFDSSGSYGLRDLDIHTNTHKKLA